MTPRQLALSVAGLMLGLVACEGCSKSESATPAAPGPGPAASSAATPAGAPRARPVTDTFTTSAGPLRVTPVYHATVLLEFGGKVIYLDPWSKGDFTGLPKADYVFITDIHADHFDPPGLDAVRKPSTVVVAPPAVAEKTTVQTVLKNGESKQFEGFGVEAVPMYNLTRGPAAGKLYHDKGRGDGYVFTFGDERVYVSGDTECTAEMRALTSIDVAFVCMNLPYTMPPAEAAECVKAFRPKVVIPYHYKDSNLDDFKRALRGQTSTEVRERNFY